jgi:predicted  nucleic acid-binding Zn-ribbon protein
MHDANLLKVKIEVVALDEFLTNMQGDTKKHFEALMSQLGEAQEPLEEKEAHEHEVADEIVALSQALEEEQGLRAPLEDSLVGLEESHNLNISKLTKDHDHALTLAKVLKNEKS